MELAQKYQICHRIGQFIYIWLIVSKHSPNLYMHLQNPRGSAPSCDLVLILS